MTTVYKKLMQARIALHGMKIAKGGRNEFAKYNYMELADFLIPTQQIFADIGLCGVVSFSADLATLTVTDTDDGTQIVLTSPMGSAALKGCHEVQNIGAVETYQRRYLWVACMEIVEHDAIDSSEPIDYVSKMKQATDIEMLKLHFAAAWKMADTKDRPAIKAAYDKRNAELSTKETAA